jgi:glycosyltransferase involved in cell wall biosynthesis
MKKRILLVTDVYGWGGHVRAEYIKKHLSDEFDFDITDGDGFGQYSLITDNDCFTQKDIDELKNKSFDKEILSLRELRKYCGKRRSKNDYDLIYLLFHTMLLRKDVRRLLRRNDRKFLTIVTAYPVLRAGFASYGMNEAKKTFLNEANKCVGVIANNYKSLEDLKSIYNGKTFYAPRGVDEKIFYPMKTFVEKPENEFTVAFVGKKENTEKGFLDFIKPACQMAEVRLIDNQRNFTDALSPDEMREFYNQADAYIVASVMDGTPNTALEAAACGLPIISNYIGNMPDLINNHKNSWLVDERNVQKYAHRLNWMKKHQRTTWEAGQKIREEVLKNWTWKKVLNENERIIFRELLE